MKTRTEIFCISVLVLLVSVSCNKGVDVQSVRLSESSLSMKVGETVTLSAIVEPSSADYDMFKWSSSDPFIASVEDGIIRANKVGTTRITATAGGITSSPCVVTVDVIHVQDVTLNVSTAEITEGERLVLYSAVFPSNADNTKVFWTSGDDKIATVSDQGVVTGVAPGIVRITVTSEDMGLSAMCHVTVKQKVIEVSGVSLSSEEITLTEGETHILVATVIPENATVREVSWSSSDKTVAKVDASTGKVTAVSIGEAVITCSTVEGGKTAACKVIVSQSGIRVTGVSLDPGSLTMAVGETGSIKATVAPADATNMEVKWSSSDETVVTVDPLTGTVTAKSAGSAVITCTTVDGSKTAACEVTVVATIPVTQVTLSASSLSLSVGQTRELTATVHPDNASDKRVEWRSNNSPIATVSSDGVVTAKSAGIAIISAISVDGGKSASCRVTVSASSVAVTGVSLDRTSLSMFLGTSTTLHATVTPSNATDNRLNWSSSNASVVSVSDGGVVTAVGTGSAVVTVKTVDGGKSASARVEVTSNTVVSMTPHRGGVSSGESTFRYSSSGDYLMTSADEVSTGLYDYTGLTRTQFHALFDLFSVVTGVGDVSEVIVNNIHTLKWALSSSELSSYSGEDVSIIVRYENSRNPDLYVDILLRASVAERKTTIALSPSGGYYIAEYWSAGYESARYHVNVPYSGESSPGNCQFMFDINAPFMTYPKNDPSAGKLRIDGLDHADYFFCRDMEKVVRVGDINVKFSVSSDGESLYATVGGVSELVASIINGPTIKESFTIWNMFTYNKDGNIACKLLNTGSMYVFIGAKVYLSSDDVLNVTFDGKDHFRADLIRPMSCSDISSDRFIAGIDFGEKGSYIEVDNILDLYDWRARHFEDYPNYYGYYGPVEFIFDLGNAQCDLNGTMQALPQSIIILQTQPGATSVIDPVSGSSVTVPKNEFGYLMCRTNEYINYDFNIFVRAVVKYGFGELMTDWITIPVVYHSTSD